MTIANLTKVKKQDVVQWRNRKRLTQGTKTQRKRSDEELRELVELRPCGGMFWGKFRSEVIAWWNEERLLTSSPTIL